MERRAIVIAAGALMLACGGSDSKELTGTGGSASGGAGSGGAAGSSAGTGGQAGSTSGGAGGLAGGASGGAAGSGGTASALDPTKDGPFTTASVDATAVVTSTSHNVPMHCVVPSAGPSAAPYPLVLVLHGFQLPASQYYGYATRLGSYGYVACTADFPAGFTANHAENAKDVIGALDWAIQSSNTVGGKLAGLVDDQKVGVMGHSLGGKVSVLAAAGDARFKAVLGLDPVDTSMLCSPTNCPDASQKLPLPIPTAFLGETLDTKAGLGGQACAPAADNYQTFYAAAGSPSLEVTLVGANHMSFIDDVTKCGFTCSVCQAPTLPAADALKVARAYTVAFFERRLRDIAGYDAWLDGAAAKQAFVDTGLLTIQAK